MVLAYDKIFITSSTHGKAVKGLKKSENDQSTGHFQSFFFCPPDPKSEKKSFKSINKKNSGLIHKFNDDNITPVCLILSQKICCVLSLELPL